MGFLIGLLTVVMVLNCVILIFLVLIQLPKKDAGAGLAFGGGATDALFGAGSGNVLTKITKYAAMASSSWRCCSRLCSAIITPGPPAHLKRACRSGVALGCPRDTRAAALHTASLAADTSPQTWPPSPPPMA